MMPPASCGLARVVGRCGLGGRHGLFGRPPVRETVMKALKNLLVKLTRDEQGGEVLEYALIVGLIVVAAIAIIGSVGGKVLARWQSLDSSM
jgi:Flp pilus assembly pilin Flp